MPSVRLCAFQCPVTLEPILLTLFCLAYRNLPDSRLLRDHLQDDQLEAFRDLGIKARSNAQLSHLDNGLLPTQPFVACAPVRGLQFMALVLSQPPWPEG